jgi:oligopeptide transport system permease protein
MIRLLRHLRFPPISPLVRRRLLTALPTLIIIITLTFLLVRAAPGGPFRGERAVPEAVQENIDARYGLDQSVFMQYLRFWGNVLTGSLGPSFSHPERSATGLLLSGFVPSLILGVSALLIALMFGLGGGSLACIHPRRMGPIVTWAALGALALPVFVLGPLLIRVFALSLGWLPPGLWESPLHLVLPALSLGLPVGGALARFWRATLTETLATPECLAARGRGLSEWAVVRRHAAPRSLPLLLNYLGPLAAGLVTGSVVVEKIFAIPGMGSYFVDSAIARDYPIVIGATLTYAVALLVAHTLVDLAHVRLDPRLNKEHSDWMREERARRKVSQDSWEKAYAKKKAEAAAEKGSRKSIKRPKPPGRGKQPAGRSPTARGKGPKKPGRGKKR